MRLFGIDPKGKRRVLETIIQRPDGIVQNGGTPKLGVKTATSSSSASSYSGSTSLSGEAIEQVRQLLAGGY